MKKTKLFMACCIGLMFFASCKKDVQPTISVITDPGYASQSAEVFSNDPILVGFNVTGESLVQIMMIAEQNGNAIFTHSETLNNVSSYSYTKSFTLDATGSVTIRGTVTDANGNTATKSFDINFNEKPNAKFVGHYEGDALITGSYDANISTMDPIHDTLIDQPFATIVDIEAGEVINEVMATIKINDQNNTVRGTVNGNKVTFEAINSIYNLSYQGFTIPIDMTYNIVGTLNEGRLDLEGNCKGDGEFNMFIVSGTIEMEGILGGSLIKTE